MGILLKTVTPPHEEPQARPLGGIPDEGMAVIGHDSLMCFFAPKDLLV